VTTSRIGFQHSGPTVSFTVDLEPDCPPFLSTFRGVEEGLPALLDLLAELGVTATFFTTGDVAARFPRFVTRVADAGHELGSHGMTHTAFTDMDRSTAQFEIENSTRVLRAFGPVTSFRAPYLRFPNSYLDLLADAGLTVDCSQAKYKAAFYTSGESGARFALRRIPASVTSSVLRLPVWLRTPYLHLLRDPIVLFVHPWEFVDLTRERIRLDCRFRTGRVALDCVRSVLRSFQERGARFDTIRDLGAA